MKAKNKQIRAQVAAAWGVKFKKVKPTGGVPSWILIDDQKKQFFWNSSSHQLHIALPYPSYVTVFADRGEISIYRTFDFEWISRVARFLFCMGYDVEFLSELVTVSATQKAEWICEMRGAGFPIKSK